MSKRSQSQKTAYCMILHEISRKDKITETVDYWLFGLGVEQEQTPDRQTRAFLEVTESSERGLG